MKQGKFIIVEGGDCSGKSTFLRFLEERNWMFPGMYFTNEPGGNDYGMKIRRLILYEEGAKASDNLTKFHLYWASKAENFRKEIKPRLVNGQNVISDRFEGSTFAYQISEDFLLEDLFWKTRAVCFGNIVPEYIYFDVSPEEAVARFKKRIGESNYFDERGIEYKIKIRRFYNRFFDNEKIRCHKIDANLPLDDMIDQACKALKEIINS